MTRLHSAVQVLAVFLLQAIVGTHGLVNVTKQVGAWFQGGGYTHEMWAPTFEDYLNNANITRGNERYVFNLTMLTFDNIYTAQADGFLDFALTNPSFTACAELRHDVDLVATLVNNRLSNALDQFGGVIIVRANSSIYTVDDLAGKIYGAVGFTAFGGGSAAWGEFEAQGFNILTGFKQIKFTNSMAGSLDLLATGQADVITVRSDHLELRNSQNASDPDSGYLNIDDFRVLFAKDWPAFPFRVSSVLYPEFGFYDLKKDMELSISVAKALFDMPEAHAATSAGRYFGWRLPRSYLRMHELLNEISFLGDDGLCLQTKDVFSLLSCPKDTFLVSEDKYLDGCQEVGLTCDTAGGCICSPCRDCPALHTCAGGRAQPVATLVTSSIPFILGMATLALIFLIVAARYWLIRKEYLKTLVDYSSLTLLVNSISDMILVCDIETERIQLFNSAGCARTGYTQQEIHRLMLSDVMIHRPRSSSTASTSQSRHDVDEGGMILPAVLRDEHVPNELGLHDMDESEAGRKLHHSTNIEQIINNVAEVTTGAPPVDLSPSARANLSFSVDTKKTDDEVLIPIEEHESALRTVEVRMKNGDTFRAEANISKFNVKNGDTPGSATSKAMAVIVLRNMTAHIEVRKALRKAKNEAEVANKQKSLFLAFICHELRNPLHGIVGLNEMLMKTATAEQQESCASISECAKLMNVIVDDVLDLSKIQVGKNRLESIQFSMSALFTDLELWIRNLVNPNVVLSMDTPWTGDSGSDLLVFGDPTRLRQILLNLMSNAAKFTIEGDINIICKVIQEEKEFVRFHIEVVDTGEGIAEIDVATLFISYVQANSSVRRKHGGTGLGLCIARGLLQQMKSDICVESKLGEGSRFWFDITFSKARDGQEPAAAARAEVVRIHTDHGTNHYTAKQDDQKTTTSSTSTDDIELTPMKQPKQQSPGGAVQTLPKRSKKTKRKVKLPKSLQDFGNTHQILIVDDVVVNQRIMQSMVNQLGVSHCTAGDGQHALDILDENYSACQLSDEKSVLPIGLVLTDINMPFMDGKQLILAMRGDDKLAEIPVVVFTGNAMPSDIAELYELGSDGVVTKPFKVNNLVSAVEQAVNNRQKLQL